MLKGFLITIARAALLAIVGAALGLGVNAVSPRGIPLRPVTGPGDRPGGEGAQDLTAETLYLDIQLGVVAVVDARGEHEFESGHIPGAINLPVEAFQKGRPEALDQLPTDLPIVVYCDDPSCGSSIIVAEQLRLYGFGREQVRVLTSGFPAWIQAGYEVWYGGE